MRFSSRSFRRSISRKRKTRKQKQRRQRTRRYHKKQRGGDIGHVKVPEGAIKVNPLATDAASNDLAGFEEELQVVQE